MCIDLRVEFRLSRYFKVKNSGINTFSQSARSRRGRTRKYSEAVSGSVAGSVAKSMGMAYPQFLMPGLANSYRLVLSMTREKDLNSS